MHSDLTLDVLDKLTTDIGVAIRFFSDEICPVYATYELPREMEARKRREAKKTSQNVEGTSSAAHPKVKVQAKGPKMKTYNMNTYKHHSLGDYVDEIRERGTTDSYSTEPVSLYSFMLTSEFLIEVNLGRTGTQKPKGTVSTHGQEDVHKAVDTDRAAPSSFTSIEKKVFQIHRRCRKYQ